VEAIDSSSTTVTSAPLSDSALIRRLKDGDASLLQTLRGQKTLQAHHPEKEASSLAQISSYHSGLLIRSLQQALVPFGI